MPDFKVKAARVVNQPAVDKLIGKEVLPTVGDIGFRNELHRKAFVIAGVTDESLLKDIQKLVAKATEKGIPFDQFQREFKKVIDGRWLPASKTGEPNTGWRARLIYHTNIRAEYGAAQREELKKIVDTHPYWRWRIGLSKVHREEHVAREGMCLRWDDPWWDDHPTPDGYGCNCGIEPVSREEMQELGKVDADGNIVADIPPPDKVKKQKPDAPLAGVTESAQTEQARTESAQPAPVEPVTITPNSDTPETQVNMHIRKLEDDVIRLDGIVAEAEKDAAEAEKEAIEARTELEKTRDEWRKLKAEGKTKEADAMLEEVDAKRAVYNCKVGEYKDKNERAEKARKLADAADLKASKAFADPIWKETLKELGHDFPNPLYYRHMSEHIGAQYSYEVIKGTRKVTLNRSMAGVLRTNAMVSSEELRDGGGFFIDRNTLQPIKITNKEALKTLLAHELVHDLQRDIIGHVAHKSDFQRLLYDYMCKIIPDCHNRMYVWWPVDDKRDPYEMWKDRPNQITLFGEC